MIHGLSVDMTMDITMVMTVVVSVPFASLSLQDWASQQVASAFMLCGFFVFFAIPLLLKGICEYPLQYNKCYRDQVNDSTRSTG